MNYWVHRIAKHEAVKSVFLLEKKVLVTGYSDLANEPFLEKVLSTPNEDGRKAIVRSEMVKLWGEAHPRKIPILLRFLAGFKKGDWVLLPLWTEFGVYELVSDKPSVIGNLEGDHFMAETGKEGSQKEDKIEIRDGKLYQGDRDVDLGFYWKVEPIVAWKLKDHYWRPALRRRSDGIRFSTANISDVEKEVKETVLACQKEDPIGKNPFLKKGHLEILNALQSSLVPKTLEKLVKHYFKSIGATRVIMPSGNVREKEGDADVIADFDSIRTTIYVQVKHHLPDSETPEWAVEQIKKYKEYKEDKEEGIGDHTSIAWVVSTAKQFTTEAIGDAIGADVLLINGPAFADMLFRAGIGFGDFEL